MHTVSRRWDVFGFIGEVYRPRYVLLNLMALFAYYLAFTYILGIQGHGAVLFFIPLYLLYALVATSSIALTIAVYSIYNTRNNHARISASAVGTATTLAGGVIGGCSCATPILFGLTALGVSGSDIIALVNFMSAYQVLLFYFAIFVNMTVIAYYTNRLMASECRLGGGRPKR